MKRNLSDRLDECIEKLLDCVHEEGTIDATFLIANDKRGKFQLQLKMTKDECDFIEDSQCNIDVIA